MALPKFCCCCVNLLTGVKILGTVLTLLYSFALIAYIVLCVYFKLEIETLQCIGFGFASGINLMLVSAASQRKRVHLLFW